MHPVALELSIAGRTITVPSYGALLALATLVGGGAALRAATRAGIDAGRAIAAMAFAVLGAGLGGAAFQWIVAAIGNESLALGTLGARAVIGSLLGGLAALVVAHFVIRVPFPRFADAAVVGVPVAQAIGRIGCFLGGCCYGAPSHFALAVAATDAHAPEALRELRHPWPLYESAADLVIAAVLAFTLRGTRPGVRTAAFFALYAAARVPLELLRGDDADRGMFFHGHVSASQLACGVVLVLALVAIAVLSNKRPLPVISAGALVASIIALVALLPASPAAADAIAGARDDCPRGTHATMPTRHGEGSSCELYPTCTRSAACGAHHRCVATAICVDGDYVVGACGPRGACERGTCSRARRCAGDSPFGSLPLRHPFGGGAMALAGLGAGIVTVRRRRRRSATLPPGPPAR